MLDQHSGRAAYAGAPTGGSQVLRRSLARGKRKPACLGEGGPASGVTITPGFVPIVRANTCLRLLFVEPFSFPGLTLSELGRGARKALLYVIRDAIRITLIGQQVSDSRGLGPLYGGCKRRRHDQLSLPACWRPAARVMIPDKRVTRAGVFLPLAEYPIQLGCDRAGRGRLCHLALLS